MVLIIFSHALSLEILGRCKRLFLNEKRLLGEDTLATINADKLQ